MLKRFIVGLTLLSALSMPMAFGKSHAKSGKHAVHVHSYTKKNGQRVRAHTRRPPRHQH